MKLRSTQSARQPELPRQLSITIELDRYDERRVIRGCGTRGDVCGPMEIVGRSSSQYRQHVSGSEHKHYGGYNSKWPLSSREGDLEQ
jgi:hypothetical protein